MTSFYYYDHNFLKRFYSLEITQEKLTLYFGVLIRHGATMTLFNQPPKGLTSFLPPPLYQTFLFFFLKLFLRIVSYLLLHRFIFLLLFHNQLKFFVAYKVIRQCFRYVRGDRIQLRAGQYFYFRDRNFLFPKN